MSVFCTSKLFTPYHHCKIFSACELPLSSATLLCNKGALSVCIIVITRAGANRPGAKAVSTFCEKEKMCKSAARTREWRKCQSEEWRSETLQSDLMGHVEGCTCLSEDRQNEIRHTNLMGYAEGRTCLSEDRQNELRQTNLMGHAEGCTCLSEVWWSEIWQTASQKPKIHLQN
jgi:hypothetical protein